MMNDYKIEIKEELSRVINVQATNYDEAVEKVRNMYRNEEIILDYSDLKFTDFKQSNNHNRIKSFNLSVDYDSNKKDIYIDNNSGSGAVYKCNSKEDILHAINMYIDLYIPSYNNEKKKSLEKER